MEFFNPIERLMEYYEISTKFDFDRPKRSSSGFLEHYPWSKGYSYVINLKTGKDIYADKYKEDAIDFMQSRRNGRFSIFNPGGYWSDIWDADIGDWDDVSSIDIRIQKNWLRNNKDKLVLD